jgi:hypothetical protein
MSLLTELRGRWIHARHQRGLGTDRGLKACLTAA